MAKRDSRQKIIDGCLQAFAQKGCRFTLGDIESQLGMSRRTIYRYFESKEEILKALITETGREVHEQQRRIYSDETLGTHEKLFRILTIETREELLISVENLYEVQKHYPDVYRYFMAEYETEWDLVRALLLQGMREGIYRGCCVDLVRALLQNGMQMFYRDDLLARNGISYQAALHQMVHIVLDGISVIPGSSNAD